MSDDEDQLKLIRGEGEPFDPAEVALVASREVTLTGSSGGGKVDVLERHPGYLALDASSSGEVMLVVSENFVPGWKAKVDGVEKPILRVNYMLRGVSLRWRVVAT